MRLLSKGVQHRINTRLRQITLSLKYRPRAGLLADVVEKAKEFVDALRLREGPRGAYLYRKGETEPILYSSLFAALFWHLVENLAHVSGQEKQLWIDYICLHQDEDGLFKDPKIANDIAETEDWWGWRHLTLHALMALNALGGKPCYPLHFLDAVSTPVKMRSWLGKLDWDARISFTSNAVQNYGTAMQYARDFLGESSLNDSVAELLAWLSERCNPRSGLWGGGISDPAALLSEGVQAGYHFWLLYWYEGYDIPYAEKAFEAIMGLQNPLGGFNLRQMNSSACEDIDCLDPLVRMAIRHGNLYPLAWPIIGKGLQWVLYNFNADGGACFRRNSSFRYGHDLMFSEINESSIFATWFRTLSIALCCELLKDTRHELKELKFYYLDCPGLQYSPYPRMQKTERG